MFQNCISRDVLLVARRTRQIPVFGLCRYTLIGMGFLEFLAIVVILIAGHLNVAYLEAAESIETKPSRHPPSIMGSEPGWNISCTFQACCSTQNEAIGTKCDSSYNS